MVELKVPIAEYKAYAERFRREGDFSLWHPGAKRLEGWRQLADLGLVHGSPAWAAAAESKRGGA